MQTQNDILAENRRLRSEMDALAIKYVRAVMEARKMSYARPLLKFLLPTTKKRGRKRETNYFRDRDIALAIWKLRRFGYKPYRNRAQDQRESACSIVASALTELNLSPAAIEKIWQRFCCGKLFTPMMSEINSANFADAVSDM